MITPFDGTAWSVVPSVICSAVQRVPGPAPVQYPLPPVCDRSLPMVVAPSAVLGTSAAAARNVTTDALIITTVLSSGDLPAHDPAGAERWSPDERAGGDLPIVRGGRGKLHVDPRARGSRRVT